MFFFLRDRRRSFWSHSNRTVPVSCVTFVRYRLSDGPEIGGLSKLITRFSEQTNVSVSVSMCVCVCVCIVFPAAAYRTRRFVSFAQNSLSLCSFSRPTLEWQIVRLQQQDMRSAKPLSLSLSLSLSLCVCVCVCVCVTYMRA